MHIGREIDWPTFLDANATTESINRLRLIFGPLYAAYARVISNLSDECGDGVVQVQTYRVRCGDEPHVFSSLGVPATFAISGIVLHFPCLT